MPGWGSAVGAVSAVLSAFFLAGLIATSAWPRMHAGPNMLEAGHRLQGAIAPLDGAGAFGGPAVAYSLRRLKSTYAGPGIKLRRTTGGTQDINFLGFTGFTGAPIDAAAANAFCNATTCFLDTWYDQSGNARHLTQATAANQLAYVADCGGGLPCAVQTAAVQTMASVAVTWAGAKTTLSFVGQRTAGPTVRCYYLGRNAAYFAAATVASTYLISDFVTEFVSGATATEGIRHAGMAAVDGAASLIRVDAAETAGNVAGAAGTAAAQIFPFGAAGTTCGISEAIIWDNYALTSGERAVLQQNQKSYWGTP